MPVRTARDTIEMVARMSAEGKRSGEIAKALGLTPKTVYNIKHNYTGLIIQRRAEMNGTRPDGTPLGGGGALAERAERKEEHMSEEQESNTPKQGEREQEEQKPKGSPPLTAYAYMGKTGRSYTLNEKRDMATTSGGGNNLTLNQARALIEELEALCAMMSP